MNPFKELSQEEFKKVTERVGDAKCRFCGTKLQPWRYITTMPYLSPENQLYITAGDKLVSLLCPNCGSISIFKEEIILR